MNPGLWMTSGIVGRRPDNRSCVRRMWGCGATGGDERLSAGRAVRGGAPTRRHRTVRPAASGRRRRRTRDLDRRRLRSRRRRGRRRAGHQPGPRVDATVRRSHPRRTAPEAGRGHARRRRRPPRVHRHQTAHRPGHRPRHPDAPRRVVSRAGPVLERPVAGACHGAGRLARAHPRARRPAHRPPSDRQPPPRHHPRRQRDGRGVRQRARPGRRGPRRPPRRDGRHRLPRRSPHHPTAPCRRPGRASGRRHHLGV
jgi:hypothetical protein